MEDFVSYEQSVKLKELGFNWPCDKYYATQCYCEGNNPFFFDTICPGDLISSPRMKEDENDGWIEDEDYCVLAPTLSQAQKWLREIKWIHIEIRYGFNPQYEPWLGKVVIIKNYPETNIIIDIDTCDTYEEVLSEGINKALEFLKQQSNGNQD